MSGLPMSSQPMGETHSSSSPVQRRRYAFPRAHFAARRTHGFSCMAGNSATVLTDLDGDGLNDLVTTEYGQNTTQIFLHNTQVIAPTLQTATDLTASPSGNIQSGIPITFTVTEIASSGQPVGSVDLLDFVGFPPYKVIANLPLVGNTREPLPRAPSLPAFTDPSPSFTVTLFTLPASPQARL